MIRFSYEDQIGVQIVDRFNVFVFNYVQRGDRQRGLQVPVFVEIQPLCQLIDDDAVILIDLNGFQFLCFVYCRLQEQLQLLQPAKGK